MTDKEFVQELRPWGFAVLLAAMIGISASRLAAGLSIVQSLGYSFSALLLMPIVWVFAGRYARYWLLRVPRRRVQVLFVLFWALLTAKLFFLPWPGSLSAINAVMAAMVGCFAGFAASQGFRRIAAGDVEPLRDTTFTPSLLHPILIVVFGTLLLV